MNSTRDNLTPAQTLSGKELANGWKVEKLIERPENATGGHFSSSYIVRHKDGRRAFLKAMDYRKALEAPDPAVELQVMTAAYTFERAVLEKCRSRHLSRIVQVLDSGTLPPAPGDPSSVVQYLVFELADHDIRSFVEYGKTFETVWILRNAHEAAAALQQLHNLGIAHQDVKPSNVLVFENKRSKLADLGRASDRSLFSPYDENGCPGDLTYAPPELLYGQVAQDWRTRRLGCDLYLLGSLVVFFLTGVSMTHLIQKRLDPKHHHSNWGDTYEAVLPYIQQCYMQVVRELRSDKTIEFSEEIAELVKQLCHPDPLLRGDPVNIKRKNSQYSLERFVSAFNLLAKKSELRLLRRGGIKERLN